MLVNLTPHPITIYPTDCPDRIERGSVSPRLTIHPSGRHPTARVGEVSLGTAMSVPARDRPGSDEMVDVEYVEYATAAGTVHPLPPPGGERTWYIVSLVVAIQQTYGGYGRSDLLVPYREVRDLSGAVVGCRQLARPV